MKLNTLFVNICLLVLLLAPMAGFSQKSSEKPARAYLVAAIFHEKDIEYKCKFGDNWCQTWAADDNIYIMLDDGNGWWGSSTKQKGHPDWQGPMLIRIENGLDFTNQDVEKRPCWPKNPASSPLYTYGTVSVDNKNFGKTFYRWNGQKETAATFGEYDSDSFFFYKEDPVMKKGKEAYAFNWIAFAQSGKDNSEAKDNYVYMYAPEQYNPAQLAVIRVDKDKILEKKVMNILRAGTVPNTNGPRI